MTYYNLILNASWKSKQIQHLEPEEAEGTTTGFRIGILRLVWCNKMHRENMQNENQVSFYFLKK